MFSPGQALVQSAGETPPLIDLLTLGGNSSYAVANNEAGQVVGVSDVADSDSQHAFIWDAANEIRDLGTLGGRSYSYAAWINAAGQVVGYSSDAFGSDARAFLWDAVNEMQDLGTLAGGLGNARAVAINDLGQVAGVSTSADGPMHVFRWAQDTGMEDLGAFGEDPSAVAINSMGQVIGWGYFDGGIRGFMWDLATEIQDLGTLGADAFGNFGTLPRAINGAGQVVGDSVTTDGRSHAFIWDAANGMRDLDLGILDGDDSAAVAINEAGQVVGVKGDTHTGNSLAFIWDAVLGMRDLGSLGGSFNEAHAINAAGQVVGVSSLPWGEQHAFVWDAQNGMRDLDTLGGSSSSADAISDAGQIVGSANASSGYGHAFAVRIPPDTDGDGQTDADEVACGSNPNDAGNMAADFDGDRSPDCVDDDDNDGVRNVADNCPAVANPDQSDGDVDGIGNICDPNLYDGPYLPAGALDPTFGVSGLATGPALDGFDVPVAVVIQPHDGRIVTAGWFVGSDLQRDFGLTRHLPDGSIDLGFGDGGHVGTDFNGHDVARALALQPDGKIVVAGEQDLDGFEELMALARYSQDGSLDLDFGESGTGKVTLPTHLASDPSVAAVMIQPDGKIVAVGTAESTGLHTFMVVRLDEDGRLDETFGSAGIVTPDFGNPYCPHSAYSALLQPDGKIVVAGENDCGWIAVARFNPDGTADETFGAGYGLSEAVVTSNAHSARGVGMQHDGKLVVVVQGTSPTAGYLTSLLVRFETDGDRDWSLGTDGLVVSEHPESQGCEWPTSVAIDSSDRIVVAGRSGVCDAYHTSFDFLLERYGANGSSDLTFGNSGRILTDIETYDTANALAIQTDGKLVVAGTAQHVELDAVTGSPTRGNTRFVLARYLGSAVENVAYDGDGDGVADRVDAFPLDATESVDTDGDRTGDNADPDDDNDGIADTIDGGTDSGGRNVYRQGADTFGSVTPDGWRVTIVDRAGGEVQATIEAIGGVPGGTARISACGGAYKEIQLNNAGETARWSCASDGTLSVTAVTAVPTVEVSKVRELYT